MNQVTYFDYYRANIGVAICAFAFGVLGAMLSGLWAFTQTRVAGHICILLTTLSGITGLLGSWAISAWFVRVFGLYEFEDVYTGAFPWTPVIIWLGVLSLTYALARLHAYSLTLKTKQDPVRS